MSTVAQDRDERGPGLCGAVTGKGPQVGLCIFLVDIWVYEIFRRISSVTALKPLEERWRSGESRPESIRASTRAMPVERIENPYYTN